MDGSSASERTLPAGRELAAGLKAGIKAVYVREMLLLPEAAAHRALPGADRARLTRAGQSPKAWIVPSWSPTKTWPSATIGDDTGPV